jgi:hypothetical protein
MNMQALTRTNNCVFALTYHMVLVTKRLRPVLTGAMIDQARGIATERCAARGGRLIELNGEGGPPAPAGLPVADHGAGGVRELAEDVDVTAPAA